MFLSILSILSGLVVLVLPPSPARGQTIDILAAASTTEAVTAIAAALKQSHGIDLRPTFAASSTLAKHIVSGAPAHLYLSADLAWMTYLRERNLLANQGVVNLLGNNLVLLHRAGEPGLGGLANLAQTLGRERLLMGDPAHVPAGRYGRQALQSLDLWKAVKGNAVFGASVRAAIALLARGQGRFAVAYGTDARAHDNLSVAEKFPAASHSAIVYPLAIIRHGDSPLVRKVYKVLQGREAGTVFTHFGFTFLPKPR